MGAQGKESEGKAISPSRTMPSDKVNALAAMLTGFGLGCALIYAVGGRPLAVMRPSVDMAALRMQPALTSQSNFMPMQLARPRSSTVAKAERREMMAGLALGLGSVAAQSKNAFAVTGVDVKDDRGAVKKGFDIIYEARELDLPQNQRDGLSQFRDSVSDTKNRLTESSKRIKTSVLEFVNKNYWPSASNELRRQLGTMRFDLNTVAATKEGSAQTEFLAAKKKFISDIEKLDLAVVNKNQKLALDLYATAVGSMDSVLKLVA